MKKKYKIEVDCANCAAKMEDAAKTVEGVVDASVNYMMLNMTVEFAPDADIPGVMREVLKKCRKVESECEIYF